MSTEPGLNGEILLQLVQMKMPYGKYKDVLLCNLPGIIFRMDATQRFSKG